MSKEKIPVNKDNCVIVRIWTSCFNKKISGNSEVGHVSLEFTSPKDYLSLWPEGQPDEKLKNAILEKRTPHYMASLDEDIAAEDNNHPQITISLYTLDIQSMRSEVEKIKSSPDMGWTLLGNNIFIHGGSAHSCASFALKLLKAGGIYELASSLHSFKFSSVVAPDTLLGTVKAAKKAEIKRFPITCQYDQQFKEDETIEASINPEGIKLQANI